MGFSGAKCEAYYDVVGGGSLECGGVDANGGGLQGRANLLPTPLPLFPLPLFQRNLCLLPFSLLLPSSPALPPLNTAPTQPLRTGSESSFSVRNTSNASTLTSHILFFITLIFSWHRYIVQP
ncbi:hypothetical protein Fmac_003458 [Flemingia macrophylla]|uniref:Uncharacterized protein n=1 Tax=Flemingia macrophylla TaxID=520843 RepID=A0ABD1NPP6_9FABA